MLIMMMASKGIQGAQHDSSFVEDLRVPSAGVPWVCFLFYDVSGGETEGYPKLAGPTRRE